MCLINRHYKQILLIWFLSSNEILVIVLVKLSNPKTVLVLVLVLVLHGVKQSLSKFRDSFSVTLPVPDSSHLIYCTFAPANARFTGCGKYCFHRGRRCWNYQDIIRNRRKYRILTLTRHPKVNRVIRFLPFMLFYTVARQLLF